MRTLAKSELKKHTSGGEKAINLALIPGSLEEIIKEAD